jgi:hypothetical protein
LGTVAVWKQRESYNLHELALVFAKEDPSGTPKSTDALGFLKLLQEDAMNRKLATQKDRHAEPSYKPDLFPDYFNVQKTDVMKWAGTKEFDISHIA